MINRPSNNEQRVHSNYANNTRGYQQQQQQQQGGEPYYRSYYQKNSASYKNKENRKQYMDSSTSFRSVHQSATTPLPLNVSMNRNKDIRMFDNEQEVNHRSRQQPKERVTRTTNGNPLFTQAFAPRQNLNQGDNQKYYNRNNTYQYAYTSASPQNIPTWSPVNQYFYPPPYPQYTPIPTMITTSTRKVLTIIDPNTGTVVNTIHPKEEKMFEFTKTKPITFTDPAIRDRELREQKEREEEARHKQEQERLEAAKCEALLEKKRQEERKAQEEQESRRVINELEAERKKKSGKKVFKRIEDLGIIRYPTGIVSPIQDERKHIYSIDFLLQFQQLCLDTTQELLSIPKEEVDVGQPLQMGKLNTGRPHMESYGSSRGRGRGGMKIIRNQQPAVQPLERSDDRWTPSNPASLLEGEHMSQEYIARKVKGLLNKLTLEKFDAISAQIFDYARQSEKEENGCSLNTVMKLTFEKACDEPNFVTMWARLCRAMCDSMTDKIRDTSILNDKGNAVSGVLLFRKYLFNRCQSEFEKGWKMNMPVGEEAENLMSDEYYAATKAKRQGLGLIQFIGELFKMDMLSERIMYTCMLRLCNDPLNAGDEEAESLCKLLTTIGKVLDDRPKTAQWLDVILNRMKTEMTKSPKLSSRVRFMIEDLLDLRKNDWEPRNANQIGEPTTIAKIHEMAEKDAMKRTTSARSHYIPMARNGSNRSGKETTDGWNTIAQSNKNHFGKTDRSRNNMPNTLGPSSSSFASLSRGKTDTNEGRANMFNVLSKSEDKPAKLKLSDQVIKRKCKNILEEYFSINDKKELVQCVKELNDPDYLVIFIGEMLTVVERKAQDIEKMCDTIQYLNSENLLQKDLYVRSFKTFMEGYDDLTIDVPQAPRYVAQLLLAASIKPEEVSKTSFISLQNAYKTLSKSN